MFVFENVADLLVFGRPDETDKAIHKPTHEYDPPRWPGFKTVVQPNGQPDQILNPGARPEHSVYNYLAAQGPHGALEAITCLTTLCLFPVRPSSPSRIIPDRQYNCPGVQISGIRALRL